jgi:hypothetical protein
MTLIGIFDSMAPHRQEGSIRGWKEIAVKKCVVKLSAAERECLAMMVSGGKHPAQKLTKARILLKADAGEGGEGWSDSKIAEALDTSVEPQTLACLSPAAHIRWCGGGQADRAGLFAPAARPRAMDVEPSRRQGGRTQYCRQRQ